MAISVINNNAMNLTRSLEKILDECSASGELRLANRKLKDFPKYYSKFNLSDTVFAGKRLRLSMLRELELINLYANMFLALRKWIFTSKNSQMHEELCELEE